MIIGFILKPITATRDIIILFYTYKTVGKKSVESMYFSANKLCHKCVSFFFLCVTVLNMFYR